MRFKPIMKENCCGLVALFAIALTIGELHSAAGDTVDPGLIAHWRFDEDASNVIRDSSGQKNDGIIVPPNTSMQNRGTGIFAGSVSFSGHNDHFVRVPASASLNSLKSQITVVAFIYPRTLWVPDSNFKWYLSKVERKGIQMTQRFLGAVAGYNKTESLSSPGYIAVVQRQWRETMHPDQYYLGYGPENNVLHYKWHVGLVGEEVSLYRLPNGQDKPSVGAWVHLVGTYNGKTGKMSLYVDGDLIGTQTHVGEIRLDQESLNRPLAIGAELNGASIDDATGEFDGYVRDVRIYNRALSDEEVKFLAEEARRQVRR